MSAPFDELDLAGFDDVVFGGSEIRDRTMRQTLDDLIRERVLSPDVVAHAESVLNDTQGRIRPGIDAPSRWQDFETVCTQLREFKTDTGVDRLIVLNLASTEATASADVPRSWSAMRSALQDGSLTLPPSVVYAAAAFETGGAFVNFTPSSGSSPEALTELAAERGLLHAGCDGKTGETLIKTALAPMFAARRLHVDSWFSQNVLGNNDGRALSEDERREAKLQTKRAAVNDILGYDVEGQVNIDYLPSFGDWKVAWNHIHFRGFGGTPMTMEFTWRGCDTALAAPLCVDLIRFVDRSMRDGESGVMSQLGIFFKSPMGNNEHRLSEQYRALCRHYLSKED